MISSRLYSATVVEVVPSQGGSLYLCPQSELNFKPIVSCIEEEAMSLSVFLYLFVLFFCQCCSFNLSLCDLQLFVLSYVIVSRPYCLSESSGIKLRVISNKLLDFPCNFPLLLANQRGNVVLVHGSCRAFHVYLYPFNS